MAVKHAFIIYKREISKHIRDVTNMIDMEEQKMIKLFISQPMRGKTDEEILAVREKAIASAKRNFKDGEVEVLDSIAALRGSYE